MIGVFSDGDFRRLALKNPNPLQEPVLPYVTRMPKTIQSDMLAVEALLKKRQARTRLMLTVHDELVFELAKEEAESLPPLIQKAMEGAMKLDVPVRVEMGQGRSWADAKG